MWEYMYAFQDPVLKKVRAKRLKTLWLKLTRPQKVFYAFLAFAGQTDNGGVWQFLFNCPELSVAALETFNEIQAATLASDYRATLEEILGKAESIADLRRRANRHSPASEKWAAFAEGYNRLETPKAIEEYFFSKRFKKQIYRQMCDYIEQRLGMFAKIRESTGN